jgi:hypothetical protein
MCDKAPRLAGVGVEKGDQKLGQRHIREGRLSRSLLHICTDVVGECAEQGVFQIYISNLYKDRRPAVRVQPAWRCRAVRPAAGNVHSADGWRAVLEPVVARYRGTIKRLYFRGDAAFTMAFS